MPGENLANVTNTRLGLAPRVKALNRLLEVKPDELPNQVLLIIAALEPTDIEFTRRVLNRLEDAHDKGTISLMVYENTLQSIAIKYPNAKEVALSKLTSSLKAPARAKKMELCDVDELGEKIPEGPDLDNLKTYAHDLRTLSSKAEERTLSKLEEGKLQRAKLGMAELQRRYGTRTQEQIDAYDNKISQFLSKSQLQTQRDEASREQTAKAEVEPPQSPTTGLG